MARDMTSTMQTAFAQPVIRPVLIAYLDIQNDPIAMWTGAGSLLPVGTPDALLNGKTFNPSSSFIDVSEIKEEMGTSGGPVSILLKANDIDESALRQVVRDRRRWRGRAAYLWLGLFNEELNTVYEFPIRIKTGIMTKIVVNRSAGSVAIELTIDDDLGIAQSSAFKITDHQRIYNEDTFSSFVIELGNKPEGYERSAAKAVSYPSYIDYEQDRMNNL